MHTPTHSLYTHTHNHACMYSNTAHQEQQLVGKEEKIAELRHALTMLDQDHDALRAEADGKDERIAQLRQQLSQQVRGRGRGWGDEEQAQGKNRDC